MTTAVSVPDVPDVPDVATAAQWRRLSPRMLLV
ncbi:MAG: hypothetical protein JWO57_54, partial [Pseudonocardiales bacterium]|nr:hypothetical protein [Pseudonocardiales bacterium]